MKRSEWVAVLAGAVLLGAASTAADLIWAAFELRHRVVTGVVHGMALLSLLGVVVARTVGAGSLLRGAMGGVTVGFLSALAFYVGAGFLGYWAALLLAWMSVWILTSALTELLSRGGPDAGPVGWLGRGLGAAALSGAAFYSISGIWSGEAVAHPNAPYNFTCWTFAFACGLGPLLLGRDR